MNRKLRVGVDNLTQDLRDLTLPAAKHVFWGLVAIAICVYINAWAIALPFCLCFVIGKTGPLLLLIATPFICAASVLILSLVLSKNKPKEAEDISYAKEACRMLKEVLENGVAYSPPHPNRGEPRTTQIRRDDYGRGHEGYYPDSRQESGPYYHGRVEADPRYQEYRQGSDGYDTGYRRTDDSRADTRYAPEAPQRDEAVRRPNPYACDGDDFPSEAEVRSFYRRNGGSGPAPAHDSRSDVRDSEPTRRDERVPIEERESTPDPAESAGRNSSGEQN
jgi:hypothetical protein